MWVRGVVGLVWVRGWLVVEGVVGLVRVLYMSFMCLCVSCPNNNPNKNTQVFC